MMYKIGGRVTAICDIDGDYETTGKSGTVLTAGACVIEVEFDEDVGGHTCGGKGENGHCLSCFSTELQLDDAITEREP